MSMPSDEIPQILINGPINIIKLEGKIEGVPKKLYLCADIHMETCKQTECGHIDSIDIDKYLRDFFDRLALEKWDLFVEIDPHWISDYSHRKIEKMRYIEQVRKLMISAFKFDANKDTIYESEIFPQTRLHYSDIRTLFSDGMNSINQLPYLYDTFIHYQTTDSYNQLIGLIFNQIKMLHTVYQDFNPSHKFPSYLLPSKDSKNQTGGKGNYKNKKGDTSLVNPNIKQLDKEKYDKVIHKIVNKLQKKYHHKSINSEVASYLKKNMDKYFNRVNEIFDKKIFPVLKKTTQKINTPNWKLVCNDKTGICNYGFLNLDEFFDIHQEIKVFTQSISNFYVTLTDVFFLRRFLDKKYINNGIGYFGAQHVGNMIKILVQKFDFHITDYSYLKTDDPKKAEAMIKKTPDDKHIDELIYPPELYQCSKIAHFN